MKTSAQSIYPCAFKLLPVQEAALRNEEVSVMGAADAVFYWKHHVATAPDFEPQVEWLIALFLNENRQAIGHRVVAKGQFNTVSFSLADVFVSAACSGAAMVIVLHNHPHGGIEPSEGDRRSASRIHLAADFFGIPLDDFLIVGLPSRSDSKDFTSFRDLGLLEKFVPDDLAVAPPAGDLERLVLADPDLIKAVDAAAKLAGVPILDYVGAFLKKALRLHLLPVIEPPAGLSAATETTA